MQKLVRVAPVPVVRAGLLSPGGLVIAGVVSIACVVQGLRASRRRKLRTACPAPVRARLPSSEDDLRDWDSKGELQSKPVAKERVKLLSEELPLSPKELWRLIYDHGFAQSFQERMGCTECKVGKWGKAGHQLIRRAQYIKPLKKNAIGPREAFTEEEYTCLQRGDGGFQVIVRAFTRTVPYGKAFHVELEWTASQTQAGKVRLQVEGGVVFEKRLLVGGIIKKATYEGLKESYDAYREHLWRAIQSGGLPKGSAAPKAAIGLRSASTATKIAAEDLVKNGIFVSWGQILRFCFALWCISVLLRLAWAQNGRLLTYEGWERRGLHYS